jgi:hypothetical protein
LEESLQLEHEEFLLDAAQVLAIARLLEVVVPLDVGVRVEGILLVARLWLLLLLFQLEIQLVLHTFQRHLTNKFNPLI